MDSKTSPKFSVLNSENLQNRVIIQLKNFDPTTKISEIRTQVENQSKINDIALWAGEYLISRPLYNSKPFNEVADILSKYRIDLKSQIIDVVPRYTERNWNVKFHLPAGGKPGLFVYNPRWSVRKLKAEMIAATKIENPLKGLPESFEFKFDNRYLKGSEKLGSIKGFYMGNLYIVGCPTVKVKWARSSKDYNISIAGNTTIADFKQELRESIIFAGDDQLLNDTQDIWLREENEVFLVNEEKCIPNDLRDKLIIGEVSNDGKNLLLTLTKGRMIVDKGLTIEKLRGTLSSKLNIIQDTKMLLFVRFTELSALSKTVGEYDKEVNFSQNEIKVVILEPHVMNIKINLQKQGEWSEQIPLSLIWHLDIKGFREMLHQQLGPTKKINFYKHDFVLCGELLKDHMKIVTLSEIYHNPIDVIEQMTVAMMFQLPCVKGWKMSDFKKHAKKMIETGSYSLNCLKSDNDIYLFDKSKRITPILDEKGKKLDTSLSISDESDGIILQLSFTGWGDMNEKIQVNPDWNVNDLIQTIKSSQKFPEFNNFDIVLFKGATNLSLQPQRTLANLSLADETIRIEHISEVNFCRVLVVPPTNVANEIEVSFKETWNGAMIMKEIKKQFDNQYNERFLLEIKLPKDKEGHIIQWNENLRDLNLHFGKVEMISRIPYQMKAEKKTDLATLKKALKSELKKDLMFVNKGDIFLLEDNDIIQDVNSLIVVNQMDGPIVTVVYKKNFKKKVFLEENFTLGEVLKKIRNTFPNLIDKNLKDNTLAFMTTHDCFDNLDAKVNEFELDGKTVEIIRLNNLDQLTFKVEGEGIEQSIGVHSEWNIDRIKKEISKKFGQKSNTLKNKFVLMDVKSGEVLADSKVPKINAADDKIPDDESTEADIPFKILPALSVSLEFKFLGRRYDTFGDICDKLGVVLTEGKFVGKGIQDSGVLGEPQNQSLVMKLVCVPSEQYISMNEDPENRDLF